MVVANFLIRPTLILKCIKEGIPMHIDIGLLSEKPLPVTFKLIEHASIIIVVHHHLLVFEFVLLILEILYPLKRWLPNRHVFRWSNMQVDF